MVTAIIDRKGKTFRSNGFFDATKCLIKLIASNQIHNKIVLIMFSLQYQIPNISFLR